MFSALRIFTMTGPLQLSLQAAGSVPCHPNWRIEEGDLHLASWGEQVESFTPGIWGPGELVMPGQIPIKPLQMLALSNARVAEIDPSDAGCQTVLLQHCLQTSTLLQLNRIRPAEARRYQLLLWLVERFGRISSRGVSLSLTDMNLTHRHLAEIAGRTRVTVTKAMTLFRQQRYLVKKGSDERLARAAVPLLQRSGEVIT